MKNPAFNSLVWGLLRLAPIITTCIEHAQARSQDFCKEGYMGVWCGLMPLGIRYSEIASEAILGQQQSRSSSIRYMARRVLYSIFGCPCMHLLSQLTLNFHEGRYYGWQNSRWWNSMQRIQKICQKSIRLIWQQSVYRLPYIPYVSMYFQKLKAVQLPLDCWRWFTRRRTGELLSSDLFPFIAGT